MKKIISIDEAKLLVAKEQVQKSSVDEKLEILSEYWWYGDKESIRECIAVNTYPGIDEQLIDIINAQPGPVLVRGLEELYVPLFLHYFVFRLKYATISYLELKLDHQYTVSGHEEEAGLCPCCNYYSIAPGEDGICAICPVCFWENFGNGPNHMKLADAKLNFKKYGAMSEGSLEFVDKDGKIKYKKNNA